MSARADLLAGKPCILTPERDTNLHILQREALELGMRLVQLAAAEHDAQAAQISPSAPCPGCAPRATGSRDGGLDIASTGFRDTTRVASSDPAVWTDIFITNGPAVAAAIDALGEKLEQFEALLTPESEQLTTLLQRSGPAQHQQNGYR